MKLHELVCAEAIVPELESRERNGVIRELVRVLADSGAIPTSAVDGVIKSIIARERTRGTTGFGKGVAAPHAKVTGLKRAVAAIGRSTAGIDFAALDGGPVFGVFLILSPEDDPQQHLKAMELVFRHLQQERFRRFLQQSDTVEKIVDLLKEVDEAALAD